ncbi:hypothetical protein E2493_16255 [Sphingomonas parva]|uniref:Uncharacterized protein n=1 Tax=Sphingomonas parva TaxID=2555898 RepID=A0A4Y8ZMK1_9SPHN|nr:hypothetical protein [Sphingomonas parva]TFI57253.1 hypothetical protein E2493_16255 [Sphingomonas parva]
MGPTLTRREVQAMTPDALTGKLFGDMAGMLYPVPYAIPERRRSARRSWLTSLEFLTRPRATYRAGVCETDALRVEFVPAIVRVMPERSPAQRSPTHERTAPAPHDGAADWPVEPRRITLRTRYFVQDAALARRDEPPGEGQSGALDVACAAIDPRERPPIFAGSEHEAASGVRLLSSLIDDNRRRGTMPLECIDLSGARLGNEACRNAIRALDVDALIDVQTIAKCTAEPDVYCVRLGLRWDRDLRFEMRQGIASPLRAVLRALPSVDEVI